MGWRGREKEGVARNWDGAGGKGGDRAHGVFHGVNRALGGGTRDGATDVGVDAIKPGSPMEHWS